MDRVQSKYVRLFLSMNRNFKDITTIKGLLMSSKSV